MTGAGWLLAVVLAVNPTVDATIGAGGVYDTNLAHAPGGASTEDAAGVQGRATGGVRWPVGTRAYAYAGLRYDGLAYPDLSDLTSNGVGAEAALGLDVAPRTTLTLLPSASFVWYGDEARNSRVLLVGATIRTRPWDRLSLRAGYVLSRRDADDSVYSADAHRLALGAEARIARRLYLRAGWAWQWGDEVFYLPSSDGTGMRSGSRRTQTFGPLLEVERAWALTGTASVGLEVALSQAVHADLSFGNSWVDADPGDYEARSFAASIGWRR